MKLTNFVNDKERKPGDELKGSKERKMKIKKN